MSYKAFILSVCVFAASMMPLMNTAAAAEKYTIKEMTPQVMSALENRRDRHDKLTDLKAEGKVGETNRGYVKDFSNENDVKATVEAENKDRKTIYQTIAKQNNLENAIDTIEKVFAETQRDNANSGDKIQSEDGNWGKK